MLMQDLEPLAPTYDEEMRVARRNDNRVVYENVAVDYLLREIIYDGKRWHVLACAAIFVMWGWSLLAIYKAKDASNAKTKKKNT